MRQGGVKMVDLVHSLVTRPSWSEVLVLFKWTTVVKLVKTVKDLFLSQARVQAPNAANGLPVDFCTWESYILFDTLQA